MDVFELPEIEKALTDFDAIEFVSMNGRRHEQNRTRFFATNHFDRNVNFRIVIEFPNFEEDLTALSPRYLFMSYRELMRVAIQTEPLFQREPDRFLTAQLTLNASAQVLPDSLPRRNSRNHAKPQSEYPFHQIRPWPRSPKNRCDNYKEQTSDSAWQSYNQRRSTQASDRDCATS